MKEMFKDVIDFGQPISVDTQKPRRVNAAACELRGDQSLFR